MPMSRHHYLVPLLFALSVLWPGAAEAHDFEPERQLLVQVFPDHVDVLVLYTEAPDERSAFFNAQFGFHVEGLASELLDELAGRAILPRMLDGLEFEIVGERPRTTEPEVRVENADGRVMAAAFVRYEVPELDKDQRRTFALRTADRSFYPTRAVVYGGGGLQRVGGDGELQESPRDFSLLPGLEHHLTFAHPE